MKSLLRKLSTKTKDAYTVPTAIQIVFVVTLIGSFLVQFVQTTYSSLLQYADNPNVGGLYGYYVSFLALPALLFLIAYAMNPRQLKQLPRAFESLLLTVAALSIWGLFSYIDPTFFIGDPGNEFVESYATFQIVSSGVMVALYSGLLYWLRRAKRWA